MKNLLLALALLGCASCLGSKARDTVLPPVIKMLWEEVGPDYSAGIADALASGDITHETGVSLENMGAQLSAAIESGNRLEFISVPWATMRPYALRGVQAAIAAEEIGPNGAVLLIEQIGRLGALLEAAIGSPVSAVPTLETFSTGRYIYDSNQMTADGKPRRVAFVTTGN